VISALVAAALAATCSDAYCRNKTSDTDPLASCLRWPENTTIVWRPNDQGNPETPADTELTGFRNAFASWQTVLDGCASLKFQEGSKTVRRDVGWSESEADPQNLLVFRFKKCDAVVPTGTTCTGNGDCANSYDCWEYGPTALAVTTTSFDKRSGRIWDADIEFNVPSFIFTAVDAPVCPAGTCSVNCVCTDVQNTVTHEIGHMLGLAHTTRLGSTMAARADPGEMSKRTIDLGTQSFACDVYPKGQPSKSCVVRPVDSNIGKAACSAAPGGLLSGLALLLLTRRRRA
jgi:hypothetical protein